MPYLHPDDVLARAVAWAECEADPPADPVADPAGEISGAVGDGVSGEVGDGGWDEVWGDERWQQRVLAAQLEQARLVPGVYEQLSPAALAAHPVVANATPAEAADVETADDAAEDAAGGETAGDEGGEIAGGEGGDPVGLSLRRAGEAILARVEALEADRSRLDGRIVDAYGALHAVLGEQLARRAAGAAGYAAAGVGADELAVMELTTATAVPAGEAARRLRLATGGRGCAGLRSRLAAGTVSLLHAAMIAAECESAWV